MLKKLSSATTNMNANCTINATYLINATLRQNTM